MMEIYFTFLRCLLTFKFLLCLASDLEEFFLEEARQWDKPTSLPFHSHPSNWSFKCTRKIPKTLPTLCPPKQPLPMWSPDSQLITGPQNQQMPQGLM